MKPLNLTQAEFARHIGVPVQRINEIVNGRRGISAETAMLFAKAFSTSAETWLNLQVMYDISSCEFDSGHVKPIKQRKVAH